MSTLRINGGTPLRGTLRASGNKNAALPMIAAALLTDQQVILEHVPDIADVHTMLALAESAGAETEWDAASQTAVIRAPSIRGDTLDGRLCRKIRASLLFAAPLLHRAGLALMPPPGGDVIGRRRLDSHLYALSSLGVQAQPAEVFRFETAHRLKGTDLFLPEASVTGTAQAIMAAVCAKGCTVIRNAACEPHIQDLCHMLNGMGGHIRGIGSNTLTVDGAEALGGGRFTVGSDFAEVGSFLALGAATKGTVTVTGVDPGHYRMIRRAFRRLGIRLDVGDDWVAVGADQPRRVQAPLAGGIPQVDDGVWPQFPSDLMSVMIVLATQISGTVLFFEKMYESRMYFIDRLVSMGANAVVCDPHRAVIAGPSRLHGVTLSSPDIRAGIALVGAALCANGESLIRSAEHIDRGYCRIEERLAALGARIDRLA